MARASVCISYVMLALMVQHIVAKGILGNVHVTDAIWHGARKDSIHSHLERMLQMEDEREPEAPNSHAMDDFGIPLPAAPKESLPHDDSTKRLAPTTSNNARPQPTEQEAARLAAQQVTNAAARDAALDRKRQLVKEEQAAAAAKKKAKKSAASKPTARRTTSISSQQQQTEQRRRTATDTAAKSVKNVQQSASVPATMPTTTFMSKNVFGYFFMAAMAVAFVAALFVAIAAVTEAALRARHGGRKFDNDASWFALARGLWRRCRRAFSAARKQLTGHGSDLPLSANEGAGPLARAVAAASAFVHVFWTYLAADSSLRGAPLHIGEAVAAAIDASRRASAGGTVAPDRSSAGGAAPSSSPSYYASTASPFAAPQYQRRRA